MFTKRDGYSKVTVSIFATLITSALASSCSSSMLSSSPQSTAMAGGSAQSTAQLITRLQEAKVADEDGVKDPTVNAFRKQDFIYHARQAELAIRDLHQGQPVSQSALTYALEVPPKHLGSRTALVQQLRNAIREDERREQDAVSWSTDIDLRDPNAPSEFGTQEQLALEEIRKLETGKQVSWDEVQRALYVPPDPL
jgi:hypothetical protein